MSKVKIGTASWTDRKALYPRWCGSPEDKLRMYSSEVPIVEVDGSYYAIPTQHTTAAWTEFTPEDFQFSIKAFKLFTYHQTDWRALPGYIRKSIPPSLAIGRGFYYGDISSKLRNLLWEEFKMMLEPLRSAKKLGVVVFQFPPWFVPERASIRHLQECKARLSEYHIGVELRNHRWFEGGNLDKTLALLRRIGLTHIAVDGPQGFPSSVPPVIDAGSGTCVIRFHGRNRDGWESQAKAERCYYWYTQEEMMEWIWKIREIEAHVNQVHLIMNTNQGIENARLMAHLLGEGLKPQMSLF